MDHLTSNSLLNSRQSAYCKHHSTETALLYIHDHLVSAIGSQKYHASAYSTSLLLSTQLTMTITFIMLWIEFGPRWLQILQHGTPPRLNFCSLVSVNNLPKSTTHSLNTTHSARNIGFIFDKHFFWPDLICLQILLLPYSSTLLYPSLPRYQNSLHHCTSVVHSKLDYCNSLCHNLPKSQVTRLQQIQNSLARAAVKVPKSNHITPILRSPHWLKTTERIEYKLLSLTYKVPTTTQPSYLQHNRQICLTSSQFSLLAALALHLWSHSLSHPHHLLYE